jgi:hypothetical protein
VTQTTLSSQDASFDAAPLLDVTRVGEHEMVHVGATPIAYYPAADLTSRHHVMVHLAEAGGVAGTMVATHFGITPVYVSMLRGRYRAQGAAGLMARRRGPKGPMKVTPALEARVQALRASGLSYRAIVTELAPTTPIAYQTVRRILKTPAWQQPAWPTPEPEAGAAPSVASNAREADAGPDAAATEAEASLVIAAPAPEPATEATWATSLVTSPVAIRTRYAGAMVLHVALAQLGLWQVFADLGAHVGRTTLSVAQIVGTVALGFALRLRSIEGFKTALRRDFGALLGLRVAPSVQTLRSHIRAVAESVAPDAVLRALLKVLVDLEPVWESAYYVDGHFSPYAGGAPVAKGWNAKRRLAEPGHTDVYVHDASGRALFYLNRPLNDSLVKVLPDIVMEIRTAVGDQRILLVFDRGGYSGQAFRTLTEEGIGFITYLKGRKARRRFPADRFVRRWWEVDDPAGIGKRQRHVYRIYERRTRISGTGLTRTLVVDDGEAQIPVLTNCAEMPAAKGVHLLRLRWRQENSFKYLSTHYGIEQIIQYGATTVADDRLVENPARVALRQQIADVQAALVFQEADIGHAVVTGQPPTQAAAPKTRRAMRALEQRLARLEHRLKQTPARVPVSSLPNRAKKRATLRSDRHDLVTAIKLATYNAERLLARRFFRHYEDPRDWLTIFRSLLQLTGTLSHLPNGTVCVQLRPPDQPRIQAALEALLRDLNQEQPRMFGTGPALQFRLQDVRSRLN